MRRTLINLTLAALLAPLSSLAADATASSNADQLARLLAVKGDAARGKVIYEPCRGCHRADGVGRKEAAFPQLAGQLSGVIIKQMLDVRTDHRAASKMHPFITEDALPATDLPDLAAYLASLPVPTDNGKGDGKRLELGKKLYERDCASCHGRQAEGDAVKLYPRLAGQHYQYLAHEMMMISDGQRKNANAETQRLLQDYSNNDMRAVSDYISRLTLTPSGK